MLGRILKTLLGILSLPVCIAFSAALYEQISLIKTTSLDSQRYFVVGIITYLVLHALSLKPGYPYILGHEIMHVLATWISGGRVSSFSVSSKGGKVTTNKSNTLIALFPYFFPFYTILLAAAFFIALYFFKFELRYDIFLFLIGVTLSFHILLTVDFMKTRQTDFLHAGYLLSICLIYITNLTVTGLILSLLFKEVAFVEFMRSSFYSARGIYASISRQLFL